MTQKDNKNLDDLIREFESEKKFEKKQEIYHQIYKELEADRSFFGALICAGIEALTEAHYGYALSRPKVDYQRPKENGE